jgi:hypothetical protein
MESILLVRVIQGKEERNLGRASSNGHTYWECIHHICSRLSRFGNCFYTTFCQPNVSVILGTGSIAVSNPKDNGLWPPVIGFGYPILWRPSWLKKRLTVQYEPWIQMRYVWARARACLFPEEEWLVWCFIKTRSESPLPAESVDNELYLFGGLVAWYAYIEWIFSHNLKVRCSSPTLCFNNYKSVTQPWWRINLTHPATLSYEADLSKLELVCP